MAKKNCPKCKTIPIEIEPENHIILLDEQADKWKNERKNWNLHQVVNNIIKEFKKGKKK